MIKATTSHGTYYLIDSVNYCAKRFPAADRGYLRTDGGWFQFHSWSGAKVGEAMFFHIINNPNYDWQRTTPVVSVEEVDYDT